jgi:hypothetical protein
VRHFRNHLGRWSFERLDPEAGSASATMVLSPDATQYDKLSKKIDPDCSPAPSQLFANRRASPTPRVV